MSPAKKVRGRLWILVFLRPISYNELREASDEANYSRELPLAQGIKFEI